MAAPSAEPDVAELGAYADELLAALGFLDDELPSRAAAAAEPELLLIQDHSASAVRVAFEDLAPVASIDCPIASSIEQEQQRNQNQSQVRLASAAPAGITEALARRPAHPHGTAEGIAPSKRPKSDPNRARNERRAELAFLRRHVAELEKQLADARARAPPPVALAIQATTAGATVGSERDAERGLVQVSSETPTTTAATSWAASKIWERTAVAQRERKLLAQRENARLKLALESQLKVARSLEEFIRRKTAASAEVDRCLEILPARTILPTIQRLLDPPTLLDDLLDQLVHAHAEFDSVYRANGLALSEKSRIHAHVITSGGGSSLEVFASNVLPFGFEETVHAVWSTLVASKERASFQVLYKSPKDPDPVVAENHRLKLRAKGTSAVLHIRQIVRRFDERDRVVMVWRAFIDPIEYADRVLPGVGLLETIYWVVKKPAAAGSAFTLVQPCYILAPTFSGRQVEVGNYPDIRAMTDFLLVTTADNLRTSHQKFEDALIQGTAGQHAAFPAIVTPT